MILFYKHAFYNATNKNEFGKRCCAFARNIVILVMLLAFGSKINAQTMYGTTGLLHAPTADMQRDKTFMVGGNVLHLTPLHYFSSSEVKYTFNYYLNITIFPWLEVGYTCTINYAEHGSTYFDLFSTKCLGQIFQSRPRFLWSSTVVERMLVEVMDATDCFWRERPGYA